MSDQMPGGPASTDHGGFDQVVAGAAVGAGAYFALRAGNRRHPRITAWIVVLIVLGFIAFVIYAMSFN